MALQLSDQDIERSATLAITVLFELGNGRSNLAQVPLSQAGCYNRS